MQRRSWVINGGCITLSLPLAVSAFAKLAHTEAMLAQLAAIGYTEGIRILGFVELATALCFAIPLTRSLGFFLLNAYLGGAIAVELASDSVQALTPVLILVFGWVLMLYADPVWFLRGLFSVKPPPPAS